MAKKKSKENEAPEAEESKKSTKKSKKGSKASKTQDLENQIVELQQELGEAKDKYLRLYAEFDNYKKRTLKEKLDFMKTASSESIKALLPVLDDFSRAKKSAEDENSEEQFSDGVQMIYTKLLTILHNLGLEEMETNGEVFDPEYHEAITEIPAPNDEMKGKIIDTVENGYTLKEKIIRHAKVVVGK